MGIHKNATNNKTDRPYIQLFETVNFAFMKIFYFLVKIAIYRAFLLFLGDLCHKLQPKLSLVAVKSDHLFSHRARFSAVICDTNCPEKAEKPKKGLF